MSNDARASDAAASLLDAARDTDAPPGAVDGGSDAGRSDLDASSTLDASTTLAADSGDAQTPTERGRQSLVDHSAWAQLSAANDPFEDRAGPPNCGYGGGFAPEDFAGEASLYVGTLYCDYLSAAQPSRVAIAKGDEITLRLWQYTLTAPAGAELHLGIYVGEELPWEARVTIPREAGLIKASWIAKRDVPAGTRIVFHLHNHGDNQYNLIELTTGASPGAD